jgi:hypothetical protein
MTVMTPPARPSGSALIEASRLIGLELFDRGLDFLSAAQLARGSSRELTTGPAADLVPADRTPARLPVADLTTVMNRVLLSLLVLWVPMVCAWWTASILAFAGILIWYFAAAPTLLRDIWKKPNTPTCSDVEG